LPRDRNERGHGVLDGRLDTHVDEVPARRELVRFLEERIRSQARSGAEAEDNEEEVRDQPSPRDDHGEGGLKGTNKGRPGLGP
jgi:hypothetical protein